jgi:hypothetical protein
MNDVEAALLTAEVAIEMGIGIHKAGYRHGGQRKTFRHDNPGLIVDPADKPRGRAHHGNSRAYGNGLSRFANAAVTEPVDRASVSLDARHPALRDATTIFPSRVFDADDREHILVDGINNAKTGWRVMKGAWAGSPMYHLSLEERATCPRSCAVWAQCYGNGLPLAVRFRRSDRLIERLDDELHALAGRRRNGDGFVVRLHALGDFPDIDYLWHWARWSDEIPGLRIWGYTAHPADSEIGSKIAECNTVRPDRWRIRFSVSPDAAPGPMQTASIWTKADGPRDRQDVICPQELGKTATCGTCVLCWNPNAAGLRVLFLGHGNERNNRGAKR